MPALLRHDRVLQFCESVIRRVCSQIHVHSLLCFPVRLLGFVPVPGSRAVIVGCYGLICRLPGCFHVQLHSGLLLLGSLRNYRRGLMGCLLGCL